MRGKRNFEVNLENRWPFTVNNGDVALKEDHTTEQINTIEHFF